MKAVRLVVPGRALELQDVPVPVPGPRDVLLRVKAAGICHSDVHYRAGASPAGPLPLTLGHEVAGVVEQAGKNVSHVHRGDRVCVHYMATCGTCDWCQRAHEQFCRSGQMVGKHRDGGFAEFVLVPGRSVFRLPDAISFEHGAVLMCSSATSLHALRKARFQRDESVAVFGVGGLGASAVQLARALGVAQVFAVDLHADKLALAESFGAIPVNARAGYPVAEIRRLTAGRGVDVALELIGLPLTMRQAVQALAIHGRAALVGLTPHIFEVASYTEVINREAEIIGVSDHLASELPELLEFSACGRLDLTRIVERTVALNAAAINVVLDELGKFGSLAIRTVVVP